MGLVAAASGTQLTEIGTEQSLTQQTNKVGIYVLHINTNELDVGDTLVARIKTATSAGNSILKAYSYTFSDIQEEPQKYSVPVPVDSEIACTIEQTAGTPRNIPWKLLRA